MQVADTRRSHHEAAVTLRSANLVELSSLKVAVFSTNFSSLLAAPAANWSTEQSPACQHLCKRLM